MANRSFQEKYFILNKCVSRLVGVKAKENGDPYIPFIRSTKTLKVGFITRVEHGS